FVVDKLDHKNVNLEVDFMAGKLASTENLAIAIWEQLEQPISETGALLHCVKLFETERNFVEYFGN
ncbi:MAG: 6-carboxytetrahydropterin synthase, partial [Lentimicrobium sp.]|nr:6-carboxytetrahydropterin synthase [Lentimicrobium sp.]